MVVILLNTIVMCCEHDDESEEFEKIIELLNNVFVIIFTLEFLLKVIALRLYYFKEPWYELNNFLLFEIILYSKSYFKFTNT